MQMDGLVTAFAFQGDWDELLPLLRDEPELVNSAIGAKGYSPLHQAAWHGACLSVVGELLSLGADRGQLTSSARKTPKEIAATKHPNRDDLAYLLTPDRRTLGQLMRKITADRIVFEAYDGNRTILDQLAPLFLSQPSPISYEEAERRITAAVFASTGVSIEAQQGADFFHDFGVEQFKLLAKSGFWHDRFFPVLREVLPRAHRIPIEEEWGTVSDLFDPAPEGWGLRGDLFLWIEMRQALCLVEVPKSGEELGDLLSKAFTCLTGRDWARDGDFEVERFKRGGMSNGFVNSDFWRQKFLPNLTARLGWLRESWSWKPRERARAEKH